MLGSLGADTGPLLLTGHSFPSLRVADAMFFSEKAPEWKDGETCQHCRVQFGTFNRKVGDTSTNSGCTCFLSHASFIGYFHQSQFAQHWPVWVELTLPGLTRFNKI